MQTRPLGLVSVAWRRSLVTDMGVSRSPRMSLARLVVRVDARSVVTQSGSQAVTTDAATGNPRAMQALAFGLLAFVVPPSALLSASLAIACGIAGRGKARQGAPHGRAATIGLLLGVLALTLIAALLVGVVLFA